jgi:hypothetical protein
MIKTYNLIKRHIGDDLAELTISYIMPKDLSYPSVCESGAGELVSLVPCDNLYDMYDSLMDNRDYDLAEAFRLARDPKGLKIDAGTVQMWNGIRYDIMLSDAAYERDIKKMKMAIFNGSRNFLDTYVDLVCSTPDWRERTPAERYIGEFLL